MADNESLSDDPSIPDEDRLFRRVQPNQLVPIAEGMLRPSSAVFKQIEMSVNIESLMIQQGRPPEDTLTEYPGQYLTSVIAGEVRAKGYPIVKDTDPPNDPAHGLVPGRKTDSFANHMVKRCVWIVPPKDE